MIEPAAQVLLSVANPKSNVDSSSGSATARNKDRSSSSFGDIYSQSKSQRQSERQQSAQSSVNGSDNRNSRNVDKNTKTQDNTTLKNREVPSDNSNRNISDKTTDRTSEVNNREKSASSTEGNSSDSGAIGENEAVLNKGSENESIDKQNSDAAAEIVDDTLTADAAELVVAREGGLSEGITDEIVEALKVDSKNGIQEPLTAEQSDVEKSSAEVLAESEKYGQLAQAIVTELNASKEKASDTGLPEKESRSKIVSAIEQALVKKGGENSDDKLAAAEKLISREKLLTQENAITPEKLAVQEKILKPDLALNVNASKVLSEQIKPKDLNLASAVSLDAELLTEVDGDGNSKELASSLEKPTDALLEKILQRLDFGKLKGEDNQFAKILADKSSIADFVDQLSSKMSSESSVGSLLSASNSLTGKVGGIIPPPVQLAMNTNFNQPQWGTDFSKRIQFMISNEIKNAELRLDPPELGRINIKLSLNQDQLSVAFTSANANVRETIENTLPKLREMLQESGIQLGDANVNERQKGDERQASGDSNLSGPAFPGFDEELEPEIAPKPMIQHSVDGVIDYFA